MKSHLISTTHDKDCENIREVSDTSDTPDINYLEYLGVSSNGRVNGFALSGEVLVISGDEEVKHEVMEVLSQNENTTIPLDKSGDNDFLVAYNGVSYTHSTPHPAATYLEPSQATTCLYDNMTVQETLHFAEAVRTPIWDDSLSLVTRVIDCLHLRPILSSFIKDLTYAQRYLVLLGTEVVTKKEVFFLQDPFSHLGFTRSESREVMHAISEIAHTLRSLVVLTLTSFSHTPMDAYVDRLLLVSSTGVVYFGRVEDASQHFQCQSLQDLLQEESLQDDEGSSCYTQEELRQSRYTEEKYSLRTLPMKREASYSPFSAPQNTSKHNNTENKKMRKRGSGSGSGSGSGTPCMKDSGPPPLSMGQRGRYFVRILYWLWWRAWAVRTRCRSQVVSQLVYAGVAPGAGLSITFAHLDNDVSGGVDGSVCHSGGM